MQFYKINISQVMFFRLYTVYNKQKIGNEIREKMQVHCSKQLGEHMVLTKLREHVHW